jgi:hypothetical protein
LFKRIAYWIELRAGRRAEEKARREALERHGCDLKCPHCGTWMHTHPETTCAGNSDYEYTYRCGHCDHTSEWLFGIAPCPILDERPRDEAGRTFEEKPGFDGAI